MLVLEKTDGAIKNRQSKNLFSVLHYGGNVYAYSFRSLGIVALIHSEVYELRCLTWFIRYIFSTFTVPKSRFFFFFY
jgi:hypothetical protein